MSRSARRVRLRDRLGRLSPVEVAVLTLLVALGFVAARWQVAAHGDLSRFVVAGTDYTDRSTGVHVFPGHGYDGQFSYRLALDPSELHLRADGVTLDSALRLQRITYPTVVYLLAAGSSLLVPVALVLVNVASLGLLGLLSAMFARDAGRNPLAGLLVAGFFGFATTLGRDLTELVTAVLLVAGVLAWQRRRPELAVFAFTAAVLSRETALLIYVTFAAVQLRRSSARTRLLALLPVVAFVTWQLTCAAVVGSLPLLTSSSKNLVLPFQDLAPAVLGWVRGAAAADRGAIIDLLQLAALSTVVVSAARAARATRAGAGVVAAAVAALAVVVSLSANVWKGPADFRTAAELYVLSALVLVGSGRPLRIPAAAVGLAGVVTVLFRVTSV